MLLRVSIFEQTQCHSLSETITDLFTRRRSAFFVRRLTFPLCTLLVRRCAAVLKRRFGCGGLRTELVESCRIVTIYFLDVSRCKPQIDSDMTNVTRRRSVNDKTRGSIFYLQPSLDFDRL